MRTLSIMAIIIGFAALTIAAFAHGAGMGGGGWGGRMMGGYGYHMNDNRGGNMGQYWGGNNGNYNRQDTPRNYGTRDGWNRGNPEAPRGWNDQQAPEPAPGYGR